MSFEGNSRKGGVGKVLCLRVLGFFSWCIVIRFIEKNLGNDV
jgi:hypothetical protein